MADSRGLMADSSKPLGGEPGGLHFVCLREELLRFQQGEKLPNTNDLNAIFLAHRRLQGFIAFQIIVAGHEVLA